MAGFGESILPEGASITRPPGFHGDNYAFWKMKFRTFVLATEYGLWNVFEDGDYIPKTTDGEGNIVDKKPSQFTDQEKKEVTLNHKAVLLLQSALSNNECFRICNLKTAKQMWEALEVAYEGTDGIKENRINTLTTEFDLLQMKPGESITDFQLRYTHLINQLHALGKEYDQRTQVRKILNILSEEWDNKVTAIEESRGESMRSVAALFGSLAEHENKLKFKREILNRQEKKKGIALKSKEKTEPDEEELDDEEFAMMVRRFRKFYKKGQSSSFKKNTSGGTNLKKESIVCFECNKPGHFKSECPQIQKEKNKAKFPKKKAYISSIWGDSSDEESEAEEEEANLCLVAEEGETDEVTSYDELQSEYNELHIEFVKVVKELIALKKKVKTFEKASENSSVKTCENCESLQKQVTDLKIITEKFSNGSKMLTEILSNQRSYQNKNGLGFTPKHETILKPHKRKFVKAAFQSNSFAHCNFCNRHGHYTSSCMIRRFGLSENHKWVPKGTYVPKGQRTKPKGPNRSWVPKI